jgi:hypothetical protein
VEENQQILEKAGVTRACGGIICICEEATPIDAQNSLFRVVVRTGWKATKSQMIRKWNGIPWIHAVRCRSLSA